MSNQKNIVNAPITAGGNVIVGDTTYINNYFAAQEVKIPHRLTNNIPTNADHILGRAEELKQANDHLAQNEATILFNGIGGIGKTALATKYMAVYGSEYKHLAWITVQSTLAEAFTNNAPLLASLQITQQVQDYITAKQLDKAFAFLFHQLNLLERTLVVIDNANDLDDLEKYKNEFETANCHFLITSRNKPSEWATVDVDSLPEDDAVALFRKLQPAPDPKRENLATDEAIKSLLSKLFYHTLLIELVAKAGATGIPFADLQTMIETQFIHHEGLNERVIPKGKHGNFVPVEDRKTKIEEYIWLIFKQVKGLEDNSKQLLKAMALLPVATPFDLDFLKAHFAFFDISDAVIHLDTLIERGWLQHQQAEGQKPYFKMHPLIADVVLEHLDVNVEFADNYIDYVTSLILYHNTNPEHSLLKKKQYIPLAKRLEVVFLGKNTERVFFLVYWLALLNKHIGFISEGILYCKRSLEIAENLPEKNYYQISCCLNVLGMCHLDLKDYNTAASLVEKSIDTALKKYDAYDITLSFIYSNLAEVYKESGRYDSAIIYLEKALVIDKKEYGSEHPKIAIDLGILGEVKTSLEKYDEAAKLLEQALVIELSAFGEFHTSVALRQNNLATVYDKLGRKKQAQLLWQKAYETWSMILGEDHPDTQTAKKNLAQIQYGYSKPQNYSVGKLWNNLFGK